MLSKKTITLAEEFYGKCFLCDNMARFTIMYTHWEKSIKVCEKCHNKVYYIKNYNTINFIRKLLKHNKVK